MSKLIQRFERAVLRRYNFIMDVFFYWRVRRHTFRRSLDLARDTIQF